MKFTVSEALASGQPALLDGAQWPPAAAQRWTPDRLAERLQEFAYRVGRLWSQRSLVTDLTPEYMGSDKFREELWVVCYLAADLAVELGEMDDVAKVSE